jgi:hypothetical protein
MKLGNNVFKKFGRVLYLETNSRKQNCIQEEVKKGIKSGSVCYHVVENFSTSYLLPKNFKY